MTIVLHPSKLQVVDQDALNPGDIILLGGRGELQTALICRHAEDQHDTRYIVRRVASALLVTPFADLPRQDEMIRLTDSSGLRIQFSAKTGVPDGVEKASQLLGVDERGAFLVATKDGTLRNAALVDLKEWRRQQPGDRLDNCRVWFSTWALSHIDQWGHEEILLSSPIATA